MRILASILDSVFPPRETELVVRTTCRDELLSKLVPGFADELDIPIINILPYHDQLVQACILEAKFHGNMHAAKLLGTALYEFLFELLAENTAFEETPLILPLPLSHARLQERGYNQVERVVRGAAARLPCLEISTSLLTRTRDTAPQTTLSGHERRENMLGAFRSTCPCDPRRTYIVLDDVVTTGSTIGAALSALQIAGAKRLLAIALAH